MTIVTWRRDCILGDVIQPEFPAEAFVNRIALGQIADECWRAIPKHFPNVELGAHVIMPNHVHGIIFITDGGRGAAMLRPYDDNENPHKINVQPGSLGAILRSYKSAVSYRANKELNNSGVWQRNYYEHIIRDDKDLQHKTDYIHANPSMWDEDENNPQTLSE